MTADTLSRERRDTEARIRDLVPGCNVRVVWCTDGSVGDVLIDGDSALPETMARVAALPGVDVADWDPSPGRIGTAVRVGRRVTRFPHRYRGPRFVVVGDAAVLVALGGGA